MVEAEHGNEMIIMRSCVLRVAVIIGALAIVFIVWMGQRRTFYCISSNKCVTIRKAYNNRSYIIPGKYYGLIEPSKSHVTASNLSSVALIWPDDASFVLFEGGSECIIKNSGTGLQLVDYKQHRARNDSIYLFNDGTYSRYREGVAFLTVQIRDGYTMQCEKCAP